MKTSCLTTSMFLILGLALSCTALSAQEFMTLDDCLTQVRNAHPGTQQIVLSDALLNLQTRINRMAFLPQLNLNGKASWQSDVSKVDVPLPGVDIPTPDNDQYTVTAELLQQIYDGGMTRARKGVIVSENALGGLQYQLGVQNAEEVAITLFYQILAQEKTVTSKDILLKQLAILLERLQKNLEAGIVDKQAILETEIRQSEIRQQKAEALELMRHAEYSLGLLMDTDTASFHIRLNDQAPPGPIPNAFEERIELRLLKAQVRVNDAQDLLNRSQYHPRLSLFATAGYGKPGLNFLNDGFDTYAIVGGTLNIPLSHLYTGKASRERQVFEVRSHLLDESIASLTRDLEIKAIQYKTQIEKFRKWIDEDVEIIAMRTQLLQISDARLEGGTITTSDYLDALTDLALAKGRKMIHEVLLRQNQDQLQHLYGSRNTQNQ